MTIEEIKQFKEHDMVFLTGTTINTRERVEGFHCMISTISIHTKFDEDKPGVKVWPMDDAPKLKDDSGKIWFWLHEIESITRDPKDVDE